MIPYTEGTVLFTAKSGATLEVRNGNLYSTNADEVQAALEQDLQSANAFDRMMAMSIVELMVEHGVTSEV